jgi:restriction system protein
MERASEIMEQDGPLTRSRGSLPRRPLNGYYVQARDEIEPVAMKEDARLRLYDHIVYQTVIRTFRELFQADVIKAADAVVFNGVVETIDRSTGQEVRLCIVSVQATRQEFLTFNLTEVEPKACFRKLKGLGSAQLSAMAAIAPIVQLPTEDERYIDGRQVIDGVSAGTNLAAMDWSDFEHLIRQLFEREFGSTGADVKVTRASRDGGVDAVILDPDPIRGGKFVVQAKRYTNTVSVSAVRELYGTMINEGAVKGILVTTAQFGPDAYEFAKDKPITLLDGGNLLFLLEKHGTKAYIDLPAARAAAAAAALN